MGTITSGVVKYARTVNLGDYNNKHAEVELAFSVAEDGSDYDAMLKLAGTTAIGKVHELLALARAVEKVKPSIAAAVGVTDTAAPATDKEKLAAKVVKPPAAKKAEKPVPVSDAEDIEEGPATKPADTSTAEDMSDDELFTAAPAEITDKDIMEAVKNTAQRTKNPTLVKELIKKYGVTAPGTCRDIAKDKRSAFLKELEVMKSA